MISDDDGTRDVLTDTVEKHNASLPSTGTVEQ